MTKKILTILSAMLLTTTLAHADSARATFKFAIASTGVTITGVGPCTGTSTNTTPATITCAGLPVAAGQEVATITVAPSTWGGTVKLSGTNAAAFTVGGSSPNFTLLSAVAIPTGSNVTDNVTVTAAP